jgi:hypothetical protein
MKRTFTLSRTLTALIPAAGLAFASVATPASAQTVRPAGIPAKYVGFDDVARAMVTSTGVHLTVGIGANLEKSDPTRAYVDVSLYTPSSTSASSEEHDWEFTLPVSTVQATSGGNATIKTGGQLGPYGSINLSFQENKKSTTTCKTGPGNTVWHGQTTGKLTFKTGAQQIPSTWGNLNTGKTPVKFGGKDTTELSYSNCNEDNNGPYTCYSGLSWSAGSAPLSDAEGNFDAYDTVNPGGTPEPYMNAGAEDSLTYTVNGATLPVYRWDDVQQTMPAETFVPGKHGGGHIKITTSSANGTLITGGGTLAVAPPDPAPSTESCKDGSKTKTESTVSYFGSNSGPITWKNGSSPLTGTLHVGPPTITVPNGTVQKPQMYVTTYN